MGHEAHVTKKRVLNKVEDCVAAVNDVIAASELLEKQHNALCTDLNDKFGTRDARLDAQAAWCDRNEKEAAQLRRELAGAIETTGTLSAELKDLSERHAALDEAATRLFRLMDGELAAARASAQAFGALTFVARLRWLFTGRWPQPERMETLLATIDAHVDRVIAEAPASQSVTSHAGAFTL